MMNSASNEKMGLRHPTTFMMNASWVLTLLADSNKEVTRTVKNAF